MEVWVKMQSNCQGNVFENVVCEMAMGHCSHCHQILSLLSTGRSDFEYKCINNLSHH